MKHMISALLLGTALALAAGGAMAQDKTVKIGVLTDNSGLYSDLGGPGCGVSRPREQPRTWRVAVPARRGKRCRRWRTR